MKQTNYFKKEEFACKCGCGYNTINKDLLWLLNDLRDHYGVPITINSGCRCISHNKNVGGGKKSQHLLGNATDIVVEGVDAHSVYNYLDEQYPHILGLGKYNTFTHIDIRSKRARW